MTKVIYLSEKNKEMSHTFIKNILSINCVKKKGFPGNNDKLYVIQSDSSLTISSWYPRLREIVLDAAELVLSL